MPVFGCYGYDRLSATRPITPRTGHQRGNRARNFSDICYHIRIMRRSDRLEPRPLSWTDQPAEISGRSRMTGYSDLLQTACRPDTERPGGWRHRHRDNFRAYGYGLWHKVRLKWVILRIYRNGDVRDTHGKSIWPDFGDRPALGRPIGQFSRHPDRPLLSRSPRR